MFNDAKIPEKQLDKPKEFVYKIAHIRENNPHSNPHS